MRDDNTSRVCINYAKRWGFGSLLIGNLFAIRSTDPMGVRDAVDPVGPRNDNYLRKLRAQASLVVCAWGDAGAYLNRDQHVLRILGEVHCLSRLKSGKPGHPLYKRADLDPMRL